MNAAPGLRVLATSREPLRIGGETVWRVPSLEVPPPRATAVECRGCAAVELFVDRALSARPGLRLDDETIAIVAEIVNHLDGMPLAIELAAARADVLDLASILEHLADRFALLAGGSRTAPPRHQALRAAVVWSYDLLSTPEKDLFCRLSVFPGSFSLEAGLAVAGTASAEATEVLLALVSKSMVAIAGPDGGPARYALNETLRQFGASQLDEPSAEQARAVHTNYYLSLIGAHGPEPFGPVLAPWVKSVEGEFHNLRTVFSYLAARPRRRHDLLRALVALRRYWVLGSRRREGFELLEQALRHASPRDEDALRIRTLVCAASVATALDAEVSVRYAKTGGDLAARVGDSATAALAAAVAAQANGLAGRYDWAEGDRALNLGRQTGDPLLICEGLRAVNLSTPDLGLAGPSDLARSQDALNELLAIAEAQGDPGFSLQAHNNLFVGGLANRDFKAARFHVERQVELATELGLKDPNIDHRVGELLHFEGDYRGALALQRSSFEQARSQDLSMHMADVATAVGSVTLKLGTDDVAAARLYGFAAHELESAGFSQRLQGYVETKTDMETLGARLGDRLTDELAKGAAMTREQVSELLCALVKTVPEPQL